MIISRGPYWRFWRSFEKRNHNIRLIKNVSRNLLSIMLIFASMLILSSSSFGSCLFSRDYGTWKRAGKIPEHGQILERKCCKVLIVPAKMAHAKSFPPGHSGASWSVGAHIGGKPTFRYVSKFDIFGYYRTYLDGLWSNFEYNDIYSGLIVLSKWEKWRIEGII